MRSWVYLAAFVEMLTAGFSIGADCLPLMDGLDEADPSVDLPRFPRPGELFNIDVAHTYFIPDADYFYALGPVIRTVIRLEEGDITGHNILPGGQSGRTQSDHFDDQARLWIGNQTVPLRFELADVVAGATSRETLVP